MRLFTWDGEGQRVYHDLPYRPYFYVETNSPRSNDPVSLYQTKLRRKDFGNEYQRREAIDRMRNGDDAAELRLFENIGGPQQFLIDQYWRQNSDDDFTQFPIRICFVDIETYSPDEFPVPDIAKDTVNVITVYDSIEKKYFSWGLGEYKHDEDDIVYKNCRSEREVLLGFVNYICKDYPDILTGWNSELFDIPYLINRITKVVGEETAQSLSPVNTIYSRNLLSQFGKYNTRWHIKGMSCVDYLDVYKKFSPGLKESYKLDAIAEHELGEKKIDYGNMNLSSLADNDWQTFVKYNIQDVRLLVKMEEKLGYIELLRMLAYTGLTPFENAMGTLNIITGSSVIESRNQGVIVPTFDKPRNQQTSKFEGAYVGEPQRGFQDYIVSFDVNSLYPNIMISLNLSPETKVGKFEVQDDGSVLVNKLKGNPNTISRENFYNVVKEHDLAITKAKCLFSQKKKGIIPTIVDNFYKERVTIKKKLFKYKKQISEMEVGDPDYSSIQDKIKLLDIKQFTIKIFINTVYGYFGNKHAPIGDTDISRSITLTGQAIIKQSNKILSEYIRDKCNLTEEQIQKDSPIVYNDTDSVYITIKHLITHLDIPFKTKSGKVTKEAHKVINDIEDHLNKKIIAWGKRSLNSTDCRFIFKRESICDVGLFLQKKRYILRVLDDEGISVDKFKYTGVEVVRTTMPKAVKPYVKKVIEKMLMSKNYNETNKLLNEAYEIFSELPIEDIAFTMGISQYKTEKRDEYGNVKQVCKGFDTYKGMPIHVKAAYYYNTMLERYNLTNTYETIGSGDKVRFFYLKQPNPLGIKVMAYKYYFPDEFRELVTIDKELMFDKIIYSMVERLYESVNWKPRKPGELVQTDLFDLLGE